MKSPRDFIFGAALGISLGVALGAPVSAAVPGLMPGVWRAAQLIRSQYLYEVDGAQMEQGALDGLVLAARLAGKDPYSRALSPAEAREEDQQTGPEADAHPPVRWQMMADQVALLDIDSFMDDDINPRVDRALAEISAQRARHLVIDLRGNTGGYLDGGEHLADRFLSSGVIARYEGRGGKVLRELRAKKAADDLTVPLTLLVDRLSASASEVAAGALQGNGRATLLGEQTRGKGRVQQEYDLPSGARVVLTTERWLTPQGKDVQGAGLTPDRLASSCPAETAQSSDPLLSCALTQVGSAVVDGPPRTP